MALWQRQHQPLGLWLARDKRLVLSCLQCCMSAWSEHEGMQLSGPVWAISQPALAMLSSLLLL